jgi:hypothetical protein
MAQNAQKIKYDLIEAAGQKVLFTPLRIDRDTVPKDCYCYDLRHGDDDSIALTIEKSVFVNYFGSIICTESFDFGDKDYVELEDSVNFLAVYEIDLQEYMEKGSLQLLFEADMELGYREFSRVRMTADSGQNVELYIASALKSEDDLTCYDEAVQFLENLGADDGVRVDIHTFGIGEGGTGGYVSEEAMEYIRLNFDDLDAESEIPCINEYHFQIENFRRHEAQIHVLIVEPGKAPYDSIIDNTLTGLQAVVKGTIEYLGLGENSALVCNEDGKLLGLKGNRVINGDIIAGTFIICGDDGRGNNISLSDEQIALYRERFAEPEHYTDEQVQDAIYCEVTSHGSLNDLLRNLVDENEDEDDLEV